MGKLKTQLIKVSALAIAALLALTACGAPDSEGVPEGVDPSEKIPVTGEANGQGGSASTDMTVTDFNFESSTNAAGVITYKLSWKAGGRDYESAFTGIKSELSEEQLKTIADKSTASEVAELRADGAENKFTDAEKTSRLLPDGSGQPVEPTDFQKLDHWGETQLCWAASLSNILWNTGWAAKAVNPTTGEAFKNEDELFQFYALNFRDDGAEASEGARWFFTGTYYRAGGSDTRNGNMEKGLVDGVDFEKVCTPSQDITKGEFITPELLIPVVKKISEGAGVEFDLSLDRYTHPPKSDPYGTLLIDDAKNAYYSADEPVVFTEEEAMKLTQFYTYAEDGRIIALKQ
ncbi:MAG: hypothetical protein HUJ75_08580, partial [Parasporobacterium sp.]|nr:hypothetical protein [Parasporobacterium sp.]